MTDIIPKRLPSGDKKYSRMVRMLRKDFMSVCIYKNVFEYRTFYDTVCYRKIKVHGKAEYKRGANLKPTDLLILAELLEEAHDLIESFTQEENKSTQ